MKKLNRQERVVEEVKLALKPYYKTRDVTKEEYKDILRKSVPKVSFIIATALLNLFVYFYFKYFSNSIIEVQYLICNYFASKCNL